VLRFISAVLKATIDRAQGESMSGPMVTIVGVPMRVVKSTWDQTVEHGDNTKSWHATLEVLPTDKSLKGWIRITASGYDVSSERHDRESRSVSAELSTGEKFTLYDSQYYEKYSRMQHGPGNSKDASEEGREHLAAALVSFGHTCSSIEGLVDEIGRNAERGSLPKTVKTEKIGPPVEEQNCAPQ
jgi:hypothetical protein